MNDVKEIQKEDEQLYKPSEAFKLDPIYSYESALAEYTEDVVKSELSFMEKYQANKLQELIKEKPALKNLENTDVLQVRVDAVEPVESEKDRKTRLKNEKKAAKKKEKEDKKRIALAQKSGYNHGTSMTMQMVESLRDYDATKQPDPHIEQPSLYEPVINLKYTRMIDESVINPEMFEREYIEAHAGDVKMELDKYEKLFILFPVGGVRSRAYLTPLLQEKLSLLHDEYQRAKSIFSIVLNYNAIKIRDDGNIIPYGRVIKTLPRDEYEANIAEKLEELKKLAAGREKTLDDAAHRIALEIIEKEKKENEPAIAKSREDLLTEYQLDFIENSRLNQKDQADVLKWANDLISNNTEKYGQNKDIADKALKDLRELVESTAHINNTIFYAVYFDKKKVPDEKVRNILAAMSFEATQNLKLVDRKMGRIKAFLSHLMENEPISMENSLYIYETYGYESELLGEERDRVNTRFLLEDELDVQKRNIWRDVLAHMSEEEALLLASDDISYKLMDTSDTAKARTTNFAIAESVLWMNKAQTVSEEEAVACKFSAMSKVASAYGDFAKQVRSINIDYLVNLPEEDFMELSYGLMPLADKAQAFMALARKTGAESIIGLDADDMELLKKKCSMIKYIYDKGKALNQIKACELQIAPGDMEKAKKAYKKADMQLKQDYESYFEKFKAVLQKKDPLVYQNKTMDEDSMNEYVGASENGRWLSELYNRVRADKNPSDYDKMVDERLRAANYKMVGSADDTLPEMFMRSEVLISETRGIKDLPFDEFKRIIDNLCFGSELMNIENPDPVLVNEAKERNLQGLRDFLMAMKPAYDHLEQKYGLVPPAVELFGSEDTREEILADFSSIQLALNIASVPGVLDMNDPAQKRFYHQIDFYSTITTTCFVAAKNIGYNAAADPDANISGDVKFFMELSASKMSQFSQGSLDYLLRH